MTLAWTGPSEFSQVVHDLPPIVVQAQHRTKALSVLRTAHLLTYAGAIPFIGAAILAAAGPSQISGIVETAVRLYSALIVSFLAGIYWQIGLTERSAPHHLLVTSNLIVLVSWGLLFLPAVGMIWAGYVILFLCLLGLDRVLNRAGLVQPWFYRLRVRITIAVVAALLTMTVAAW